MAIGKQDIGLLFGVLGGGSISGESGQLIKSQLDSIVASLNNATNSKQRRIALSLDTQGTKASFSAGLRQITSGLSGQKQFKVKISEIDATQAIENVRKQLQNMLSALSVSNGVNITGLKDFLGTEGVDASLKQTAASADVVISKMNSAKAEASDWAGQMKVLNTISQSLANSYKSGISGKNMIADKGVVDEITAAYTTWQQKVEALKTSKSALSSQELEALQAEGNAIQRKITSIQNEQTAQAKATAEAERRSAAEKAAADRAAAANQEQIVTLKQVVALYNQIDSYLKRNTRIIGTGSYDELVAMRNQLEQVINTGGKLSKIDFSNLQSQFSSITANIRQAGQEGKSLGSVITAAYQKFGGWMLVTRSFAAIIRSLKQMVSNVVDVDTAMTELKKVTNETDAAYVQFLDNASKRAKTVGATLTDTINATADFARLGYNITDASALADTALVYKNVGDGIEDIGTASESVISTMKAFGIEAGHSIEIVDRFNAVGNNFAISSGGIGEALMRSASALAAANNTLDESIALITAANNVIQDPEKVGTAIKTVSMYLRAAKTEAEEAGESTEGMASSVSKLRENILALTAGKVDIQIDENTFKSTYQIIKELSEVWGDLTDITQANILEMIGGKRNSNVVSALLSNFSTAEDVIKVAANSAGSALEENEKVLESIAGKMSIFQAAFEELSTTFISSSFVKGVVDFGTASLETLTALIEKLGAFPTLITAITTAITLLRAAKGQSTGFFGIEAGQLTILGTTIADLTSRMNMAKTAGLGFFDSMKAGLSSNYWSTLQSANSDISEYNRLCGSSAATQGIFMQYLGGSDENLAAYLKTLNGGQASVAGYNAYLKNAGIQTQTLGLKSRLAAVGVTVLNTALNMLISMGISLILQGIITAITSLINKQKEARQAAIEAGAAASENADKLYDLTSAYIELGKAIDAGTGSKEEFMSLQDELIEYLGLEGRSIQELTGEYDSLGEAIIAAARTQLQTDISVGVRASNAAKDEAVSDLERWLGGTSLLSPAGDGVADVLRYLEEQGFSGISYGTAGGTIITPNSTATDLFSDLTFEQIMENYRYLEAAMNAVNAEFSGDNPVFEILADTYNEYDNALKDAIEQIDATNEMIAQDALLAAQAVGDPQTLDEFEQFRNDVIDNVESNLNFDENGTFSAEGIVDSVIAQNGQYADFLNAITERETTAAEIRNKMQTIAENLVPKDYEQYEEGTSAHFHAIETYLAEIEGIKEKLEGLSSEEFEIAYYAVINQGATTWDDIVAAIAAYNDEQEIAKRESEQLKSSLSALWSSEDFADTKEDIIEMAAAVDGISAENVIELANESDELSGILNATGMDAEFLAHILQTIAEGGNGIALITEDALKLNSALFDMAQEFDNVAAAKSRYDSAMAVEEKDAQFKSYAEAFETLNAEFEAGTVNSNAFWAAAEFLFGSDQLMAWGWSDGLDEIYAAMQRNKAIFEDADSAGAGFIDKLYEMSEAGELVDEAGEPLLEITKLADGSYDFDIDTDNLDEIAEKMGLTTEAVTACLKALSMWGDVNFYDMDEVLAAISEIGLSADTLDGTAINVSALIDQLITLGKTDKEIYDILMALQGLDGVTLLDATADVDALTKSLGELGLATDDGVTVSVNAEGLSDLMSELNFTKEDAQELINKLGEADGITLTNAQGEAQGVADALAYIDTIDFATVTENVDGVEQAISDVDDTTTDNAVSEINDIGTAAQRATTKVYNIRNALLKVDGTTATVTVDVERRGSFPFFASGTSGAPAGPALVGEEDEELVQSGNRAYLVGTNGPEIVNLKEGDRVYNAEDTKKIKRGSKHIVGAIPAYAWGTINTDTNKTGATGTPNATVQVNVSATVDNTALEDQLKETLDAMEKAISEIIGNFEHEIFMLEKSGGTTEQITAVYRSMQEAVHRQAEEYRKLGLDDNSDYIQALQKQWWDYQDSITQLRQDDFDDYLNDSKFAIEALEHDGNDTGAILASWREILNAINDEIAYYTSIGYDMSSDVIQSLVEEAWGAEESMREVLDTVIGDAQDAIDDLQDVYETLKDAAKEYAETGTVSVDTLQSIIDLGVEYLAFLRDENGQIVINEENIQRMIAAKTQQLAVESALNYVEQLRMALEGGQTEELQRLLTATTDATNATWGLVYANLALLNLSGDQYSQALDNINTLRSIADNTIANIGIAMSDNGSDRSDYYDEAGDALDTILDLTMDLIKHEKEQQVEALEEQIERYREIIDLKKESLQTTKDESDYNKEVAKRIKEMTSLQDRIDKLKLEGTRESLAQAATLESEMAEKQEELADYQADYSLGKQQDALDAEADAFEATKNEEIKIIEDSVSSTEKIYRLAIERINTNWDGLYQDLINWNYEYGNNTESEIVSAWNAASAAVQEYGSYLEAVAQIKAAQAAGDGDYNVVGTPGSYNDNGGASGIVSSMRANSLAWWTADDSERRALDTNQLELASMLSSVLGETVTRKDGSWYRADGSLLYAISRDEVATAIVNAMKANSAQWNGASAAERTSLENENKMLASRLQSHLGQTVTIDSNGEWWINGKKLYEVYHKGGVAGGLPTLKQNEVMAILEKGEPVLDKEKEDGLYKIIDFATVLSERLGKTINTNGFGAAFAGGRSLLPSISTLPELGSSSSNDYSFNPVINVNIDHSGDMSDSDAARLGRIVAENTLAELSDAFNKRGISRIGSAALKQ